MWHDPLVPSSSYDEAVTFRPTSAPARRVDGVLHIEDTLGPAPVSGTVSKDIPLCGESVGRGIRVLVVDASGVPVNTVTRLMLQSFGTTIPINIQERNLALTTIDPPTSCQQIQFQYENQNLPATDSSAQRGSNYVLTVLVGSKKTSVTFTLAVNEFKTLVVTVQ